MTTPNQPEQTQPEQTADNPEMNPTQPLPEKQPAPVVEAGDGWRLLVDKEPLQEGDGILLPEYPYCWLDFRCRPDMFRGEKPYAHSWPWRRRITSAHAEAKQEPTPKASVECQSETILRCQFHREPKSTVPSRGWTIDVAFLESLKKLCDHEYGELSLEQVEQVLLSVEELCWNRRAQPEAQKVAETVPLDNEGAA